MHLGVAVKALGMTRRKNPVREIVAEDVTFSEFNLGVEFGIPETVFEPAFVDLVHAEGELGGVGAGLAEAGQRPVNVDVANGTVLTNGFEDNVVAI